MRAAGIEHSREVVIHSEPAHVFAVLTDLERYLARWAKGPVAARKLTSGEAAAGTRFEVTARIAGVRVRSPYTVTSFERELRFAGNSHRGAGPLHRGVRAPRRP